jgi:hypothetical protein
MVTALVSYTLTAIALAVLLAVSSPRVVDPPGIATGLLTGVFLWVGTEVLRTRVRSVGS